MSAFTLKRPLKFDERFEELEERIFHCLNTDPKEKVDLSLKICPRKYAFSTVEYDKGMSPYEKHCTLNTEALINRYKYRGSMGLSLYNVFYPKSIYTSDGKVKVNEWVKSNSSLATERRKNFSTMLVHKLSVGIPLLRAIYETYFYVSHSMIRARDPERGSYHLVNPDFHENFVNRIRKFANDVQVKEDMSGEPTVNAENIALPQVEFKHSLEELRSYRDQHTELGQVPESFASNEQAYGKKKLPYIQNDLWIKDRIVEHFGGKQMLELVIKCIEGVKKDIQSGNFQTQLIAKNAQKEIDAEKNQESDVYPIIDNTKILTLSPGAQVSKTMEKLSQEENKKILQVPKNLPKEISLQTLLNIPVRKQNGVQSVDLTSTKQPCNERLNYLTSQVLKRR